MPSTMTDEQSPTITRTLNAFADVEKLGLGRQERTEVLPRLLTYLEAAPGNSFGQILLGRQAGVWGEQDVRDLETRILDQCNKRSEEHTSELQSLRHLV